MRLVPLLPVWPWSSASAHTRRRALLGLLATACASCSAASGGPAVERLPSVAFTHANILPMDRDTVLTDQTVLVVGGTIRDVGPSSSVRVPRGATVVDAGGGFLMPGLVDSHVHVETVSFPQAFGMPMSDTIPMERVLLPYLAHGVTSIVVLSGAPDLLRARDLVERGELSGPTMVVASPMLDGSPPIMPPPLTRVAAGPDSAAAIVTEYARAGYDLVKLRTGLSRATFEAVITAARRAGIPVEGHVPRGPGMSIEVAMTGGQSGISHLEEFYYGAITTADSTATRLAALAAANGVRVTSTLVVYRTILAQLRNLDSVLAQPEIRDMYPLAVEAFWRPPRNPYSGANAANTASPAQLLNGLAFQQAMARALVAAGVPVLAGSDALNPSILPGKGLWQELSELVRAGLTPYQALRAATVVPAQSFRRLADRGVVRVGARADLVLLAENPLIDVANVASIRGTMVRGRWLPVGSLRTRMRDLAGPPSPAAGRGMAFTGVHVIPMDRQRVLDDQTVLVRDGQIVEVGPRTAVRIPEGTTLIAAEGRYLVPGLADFHTHLMTRGDLELFVASGVTTVANMGSRDAARVLAYRDSTRRGALVGPTILVGFFADSRRGLAVANAAGVAAADTPAEGRDAARRAHADGFDFIKVYNSIPEPAFFALMEGARRAGMPVAGHGVRAVGLERGMQAGQRLIAHGEEFLYAFVGRQPDDSALTRAAAITKALGASVVPNLSAYSAITKQWGRPAVRDSMLAAADARALDTLWLERWRASDYATRTGVLSGLPYLMRLTRALRDQGVPLLVGTDAPVIPGVVPGVSVHEEMALLMSAGLTAFEALSAATRTPGEYSAREMPGSEVFGTVRPGARADLLLVDGNPLEELGRLRRPLGVMVRGRWLERVELDRRLAELARAR